MVSKLKTCGVQENKISITPNDITLLTVVSSSHQSPSIGVSRFRLAQSIAILFSVWSASKGSRKGGECHEANDRSSGNGCALSANKQFW